MKFFTPAALLAAALASAVVMLPFLPAAKMRSELYLLEARISSTVDGAFQVFYDDGGGFREDLSTRAILSAGSTPALIRLPFVPGNYRALRLDPLDRGGTVRIGSMRVVTSTGRVMAEIPLSEFKPASQIQSASLVDGTLEITTTPGANDPQLGARLTAPLVVTATLRDYVSGAFPYVLPVFAVFALLLFLADRAPRARAALRDAARRLARRPGAAIAVTAAIAVVASAYPVVFLGKSYVSPNLGTVLLYDNYPTLPGYKSSETVDVKLSDVGAVMWQHVPFSMIQHRALFSGELPLWNRYNAAGVPLLAQGQSMFGDPLHFLVVAANGASWAWDLKYLIAKWLFATGLGLVVLTMLRSDQLSAVSGQPGIISPSLPLALSPSLLVAAAAPFVGFFIYRINHPAFFSLCYAPWPLYCLVQIAQATTRRAIALNAVGLLVANLALMNSGTVKEAYMLLLSVNFSGACILLATAAPWRERLLKLGAVAWTGLIFILLTAPIWATFLQTLKSAYTGYNAVSAYQIQPTLLLGAFDEIFYRPLMSRDQVFSPSLNFLLLLGVLYFLATLRLHFANRAVMAFAASSLPPLALAFGLVPPDWIVQVPFLSNVAHVDNTFSCVLIVLWSVLAGLGFATAARRLGTREGRQDLIIAGLLLGALVFGWVAFRQAAHRPIYGATFSVHAPGQTLAISPFIWDYLGTLLVAVVVLALLLQHTLARRTLTVARIILIALCASVLLWRHGLHASTIGFEAYTARPTVRAPFHARSEAIAFVQAAHAREPGRGFGFQGNFFPGWTGAYRLETIHGPDALVNPWLRELVGDSGVQRLWDWRLYVDATNFAAALPFFDALNVRYYFDILSKNPAFTPALKLVKGADLDVYESPTAWPRAFFTDRLDGYDQPAQLIEKIRTAKGKPFAAIQRSDPAADNAFARMPGSMESRTVVPATHYQLSENNTTFRIHASGPGAIVLTEAYWPGDFRAEINGRKATILRLNHAFKGVLVDAAGDYTITFSYWPKNFPRNLALCGIGVVLLAGSLFLALRRVRVPHVAAPRRAPVEMRPQP